MHGGARERGLGKTASARRSRELLVAVRSPTQRLHHTEGSWSLDVGLRNDLRLKGPTQSPIVSPGSGFRCLGRPGWDFSPKQGCQPGLEPYTRALGTSPLPPSSFILGTEPVCLCCWDWGHPWGHVAPAASSASSGASSALLSSVRHLPSRRQREDTSCFPARSGAFRVLRPQTAPACKRLAGSGGFRLGHLPSAPN